MSKYNEVCHTCTNLVYVGTKLVIVLHINIYVHEYYTVGTRVWASKDWSKVCTICIMVDRGLCINIPHHLLTGSLFSTHQHSSTCTDRFSIFHTSTFINMYWRIVYFPHINIHQHVLTDCLFSTHQHSATFTLLVVYFPHITILHHILMGCLFSTHQHSASFTFRLSIFHTSTFCIIYLLGVYFPHINIPHQLLTGCLFSTHQHSATWLRGCLFSTHQHSATCTYGFSIFHTSTFRNIYLRVVYFPHINIPHHILTGCLFSTHQHSATFTYGLSIFHTSTFRIIYLRVVYFPHINIPQHLLTGCLFSLRCWHHSKQDLWSIVCEFWHW